MVLRNWDVYHNRNWYWIGVGALLGFTVLFNLLFTFALTYLNRKFLWRFIIICITQAKTID